MSKSLQVSYKALVLINLLFPTPYLFHCFGHNSSTVTVTLPTIVTLIILNPQFIK